MLHENGEVSVNNVASYRKVQNVTLDVPGHGAVMGDVAWGGNWFFLGEGSQPQLTLANVEELTNFTWAIRLALRANGITGDDGKEVDHVELFAASQLTGVDSKNFVLCPGKAYDRSPCGTGTSAKLACLYADGKLREGQIWRQESIVGTVFEGSITVRDGKVYPSVRGSAFDERRRRVGAESFPRPVLHGHSRMSKVGYLRRRSCRRRDSGRRLCR